MVLLGDGQRAAPEADVNLRRAAAAILGFGSDLFTAVAERAQPDANVIVSPTSVAIALAMVEPGATGDARRELHAVLRIEEPAAFHASMNALAQELEGRVPEFHGIVDEQGDVFMRIANAAYLQQGYPFEPAYVDTVVRHYGPVLHAVDFRSDPDAVAADINRFVADVTAGRITNVVGDGVLDEDTVMALVNALYLKASWWEPFSATSTEDGTFTRRSGKAVTVPMMHGRSGSSARGDGWVAATKGYVGGLSVQFVLPDEGRFDEVAANIGRVMVERNRWSADDAELVVPRFETRFTTELRGALEAMGLSAPYRRGRLLRIADDPRLVLDVAAHQAYVAMDEQGTEAAATTMLSMRLVSRRVGPPPVPVVLDRPFLFRIFDQQTGATLFLGRILDPTG